MSSVTNIAVACYSGMVAVRQEMPRWRKSPPELVEIYGRVLAKLPEAGGVPFEPMAGRVMKEYVVLPQAIVSRSATLVKWVRKSMAYAGALPPKKKKQRRQSHK